MCRSVITADVLEFLSCMIDDTEVYYVYVIFHDDYNLLLIMISFNFNIGRSTCLNLK